jgi:hypothetical protein
VLSVDELSVDELSVDELSVDGLSPHHQKPTFQLLTKIRQDFALKLKQQCRCKLNLIFHLKNCAT